MPNRTFAFSHRGGYWKTRYSFFSNCYAFVNKVFLSFRVGMTQTQRNPVWRHNIGGFTNFYGAAAGAGLAVSFNQKPSQNKILKSVSVEGTNNSNPASILVANNSTTATQQKQSPVIAFEDKGGILYGQVQGQTTNTNGNVKFMGMLNVGESDQIALFEGTLYIIAPFTWADGGGSNINGDTKYVFGVPSGQISNDPNTNVDLTTTYNAVPDNIVFSNYDNGQAGFSIDGASDDLQTVLETLGEVPIYSISQNNTYGDMLKGQYADAIFTFPAADWEVFSLNLEYEPTTYDHSAAANMPSRSGGRRRRRRR